MLQKLENAYLSILRTVVIIASGILLLGVIMFGLGALKGFGSGPSDKPSPPEVATEEIIKKLTSADAAANIDQQEEQSSITEAEVDPNKAYYEAAAGKIVEFVTRASKGAENPDKDQVTEITRNRAEAYDSEEITAAYAKGFSESVNKVLSDKTVESMALKSSALDIANNLLNLYAEEFNAQIQAEHERINKEQQEHLQAKAESANNIYLAAGCFGMFLLIVFLSIFIKIERNLRHLEVKSPTSA